MDTLHCVWRAGLLLLGILSAGGGVEASAPQRDAPASVLLRGKNVLMIVLDDVGRDKMESFDTIAAPPYPRTPRIDALADSGIRFTGFYSNLVCSATRACIQSGRYPMRTGMGGNTETWVLPDSEVLLSELLRYGLPPEKAYACGAFGKWHLGGSDVDHVVRNGYQRFYGTLLNTGDHFQWSKIEHDAGSPPSAPIPQSTWSGSVVRKDALRWIKSQHRPFFAYVAFNPPHREWQVPPLNLLSVETQTELTGLAEGQVAVGDAQRRLCYRATLEAVDTEIGKLIDALDPLVLENTVIFVVSDNGVPRPVVNPQHDATHAKPTAYQLGINAPLIVSGALVPDAPPGGWLCPQTIGAVDLWRTVGAIAGASAAQAFQHEGFSAPYPTVDSVSFLPLILDPLGPGLRPWAFAQFFDPPGPYTTSLCLRVSVRAITDGQYKYIRWVDKGLTFPCDAFTYNHEFYHLGTDPQETNNLLLGTLTPFEQVTFNFLNAELDALSEY